MERYPMKTSKVQIRNLQIKDYAQLSQSFTRVYSDDSGVFWTREQIQKLVRVFPEDRVATVIDDKIADYALSIIANYDEIENDHMYTQVTSKEIFSTHNPKGSILYGIETFTHPSYRGLHPARRMYEYCKKLCETLNLRVVAFDGRVPSYHEHADKMRPEEHIKRARQHEICDPVPIFQLSNNFYVHKVITNCLSNGKESRHYACLFQWDSIYCQPSTQEYINPRTTVCIELVQ